MKILQKIIAALFFIFVSGYILGVSSVSADAIVDSGINYLKSKQDSTGRITTGFSAPSQWSAIAFTANGIDVSTIKNPTVSLKDFLITSAPSEPSAATDWETRILAIVAIDENPTNFGGINYVQKLEMFYSANQIGDTCSLNDDIFGLLALVASGTSSTAQVKQDTLNFLVSKQDPDGGFGFSAPGCLYYSTSADITAAAIHSLQSAKDSGLTSTGLDSSITKAKDYLLKNQNSDGGFGYYGTSDTDTTGWVLIALNVLGMKDSEEASKARVWLVSQQSGADGGFNACEYNPPDYVCTQRTNASTTAQALIGLSGKTWILKIFTPANDITPTQSPTVIPTSTTNNLSPTPTSSASQSSSCSDSNPGTPIITDAKISEKNSVVLTWTKAPNTVDHYLLAYGTSQDSTQFGNSNIGNKDLTTYEIKDLSKSSTYYFRLRAINGCFSGNFSNTAIVTLGEETLEAQRITKKIVSPTPEVLGAKVKEDISNTPTPAEIIPQSADKKNDRPVNGAFLGFSLLSFSSAIAYWYLKLKIS